MVRAELLFLLVGGADDRIFKRRVAEEAHKTAPGDLGWRLVVDETLVVFEKLVSNFGMRLRRKLFMEENKTDFSSVKPLDSKVISNLCAGSGGVFKREYSHSWTDS